MWKTETLTIQSRQRWNEEKPRTIQFIYNSVVFFSSPSIDCTRVKWKKEKMRFLNMKNDKLFCSSRLINGKKVMKNEKNANDAVISIFVCWYKNKNRSVLFFHHLFVLSNMYLTLCVSDAVERNIFGAISSKWTKHFSLFKFLMNEFRAIDGWKRKRETDLKNKVELWRIPRHSVDPIINHWIIRDDSNFEHECNPFALDSDAYGMTEWDLQRWRCRCCFCRMA